MKNKINQNPKNHLRGISMVRHGCPRCGNEMICRNTTFSNVALAALVVWGELDKKLVGQPICDECISDLREVLVERADEVLIISEKGQAKKAG